VLEEDRLLVGAYEEVMVEADLAELVFSFARPYVLTLMSSFALR
jgi:hypothetical protein